MPASSDPPANDADLPLSAPVGTQGLAPEADEGLPVTLTVSLPAAVALHARPAADLVRAASKLQATVSVAANGKRANARSILEVLALGAVGGTELTLSATGPSADNAVRTLAEVIAGLGA